MPPARDETPIDVIDENLRLLDREVWIVTAATDKARGGLTATWIHPVSIDRETPVMLIGIAPNHFTAELIDGSGAFAVHLLSPGQADWAWDFARDSGRNRDKLAGYRVVPSASGAPVLADCLAWFACRVLARLDTGDRIFYWGQVKDSARSHSTENMSPLRQHQFFQGLTGDQRAQIIADRDLDINVQRPRGSAWRANLPPLLRPAQDGTNL